MESIIANAFAIILLWLIYYAISKYSKPLPLPSLKTLPIWAIVSILLREFGIRKGLKKLVISSKIRIFIGENQ